MTDGFSTRGQGNRFREVADRFDGRTRRSVLRGVMRGEPPGDPTLRPLALAYLERLERNQRRKRLLVRLWIALAVLQAVLALMSWLGSNGSAVSSIALAIGWLALAVAVPTTERRMDRRVAQSRRALGLGRGTAPPA